MAIPKPERQDWLKAAADELRIGDRATIKLLQESYRHINQILKGLPDQPDAAFGNLIYRAQLERTRKQLLAEQARLFTKVGDLTAARRLKAASRAAKLSRAADNALLLLVGQGAAGKRLYDGADITAQRTVETILARMGLSKVPLAERIYSTSVWMNGRLDRLITQTMAAGLNAKRFAKVARDWFAPSVPGGTRYAAMRLARTEINNAFHATSVSYAADKPWVSQMDWNLSKSHPEPDKCDLYAEQSPWDVHLVPRKPHPQCLCYVTEVSMDEDEWIDRFVAGEFDDYLDAELAKTESPTEQVTATRQPVQVQQPPAEPKKPAFDQRGFVPGNWKLQNDNEAQIREIEEELKKEMPPALHANARALAEKLVAGTTDDTDVTYRNGPHQVRFTGSVAPENHAAFLGNVDFLQANFPTGHDMSVTVAPSSDFGFNVGGETTMGTGSIHINEKVLTQETWPGMPVSEKVSSSMYVLAHEWGHALSTPEEGREKHIHQTAIKAGGMTRYGTAGANGVLAPAEGYAESFAEWALTHGETRNPAAQEYAKHFHWGDKFGSH